MNLLLYAYGESAVRTAIDFGFNSFFYFILFIIVALLVAVVCQLNAIKNNLLPLSDDNSQKPAETVSQAHPGKDFKENQVVVRLSDETQMKIFATNPDGTYACRHNGMPYGTYSADEIMDFKEYWDAKKGNR